MTTDPATPALQVTEESWSHHDPKAPSSPWGRVQVRTTRTLGMEAVIEVSTSSHGGIYLAPPLNERIPLPFRRADGWYEEDCDWSIPVHFLPAFWSGLEVPVRRDGKPTGELRPLTEEAAECSRLWHWRAWERHTGETIPTGVNWLKDEETSYEERRAAGGAR